MGRIHAVKCHVCGYKESALYGVGGDCGMAGQLVVTAVCTKTKRLVDTVPPDQGSREWIARISEMDAPMPVGPCPLEVCGAMDHEQWMERGAVCPRCGATGMTIRGVGMWD